MNGLHNQHTKDPCFCGTEPYHPVIECPNYVPPPQPKCACSKAQTERFWCDKHGDMQLIAGDEQPTWEEEFYRLDRDLFTEEETTRIKSFISQNFISRDDLIKVLASAESMETAREVRHLLKELILKK